MTYGYKEMTIELTRSVLGLNSEDMSDENVYKLAEHIVEKHDRAQLESEDVMSINDAVDAVRYGLESMMPKEMSLKQAIISFLYLKDKPLDVKFHRGYASYNWYEDMPAQECTKAILVLEKHPVIYWLVRII